MNESPDATNRIIKDLKKDLSEAKRNFTKASKELNDIAIDASKSSFIGLVSSDSISDESFIHYNKLEAANRKILGVDQTATEIHKDLFRQTETMLRVNNNIGSMNLEIDSSDSVLRSMLRRESKNKLMIVLAASIVVLIFVFILVFKLGGSNASGLKESFAQSTSKIPN